MAEVIAVSHGYFGGQVREPGDKFDVPDELWADKKRRPSWAKAAKFGGKGDHDGDGVVGGFKPVEAAADDLSGLTVKQLREFAKEHAIDITGLTAKDEIVAALSKGKATEDAGSDVFADAPEPASVPRGNGVSEALPVEPDWVAPKPID